MEAAFWFVKLNIGNHHKRKFDYSSIVSLFPILLQIYPMVPAALYVDGAQIGGTKHLFRDRSRQALRSF